MPHMLVIGGSDAGVSAALRIKELSPQTDVTVLAADRYPGFSICGLPFYLSGEVSDWQTLAHHDTDEFEQLGIRLLLSYRAESISPDRKSVSVSSANGQHQQMVYDKLLIATGAEPARPPIPGLEQPGVFLLRWLPDAFAMREFIERSKPKRCVIIGGGYIGLEMADALTRRGLEVTLVEFAPEVLTTMDSAMGHLVRFELESNGVKVITGRGVQSIERTDKALAVCTAGCENLGTDMVLVATGVRPSTRLAATAGIQLGAGGAIKVDRSMATDVPDVLAAGDCAETWHHMLKRTVYMPLGTTAHKQGRVAGEQMIGGNHQFQGSVGTQVVKVFGCIAAGTGLRDAQATKEILHPLSTSLTTLDRNAYYPANKEMHVVITGDRSTGRLLGGQIVGRRDSEIAKRIDVLASALYSDMLVEDLCSLDLSYTPPLSSPWDPLQKAAMQWLTTLKPPSVRV